MRVGAAFAAVATSVVAVWAAPAAPAAAAPAPAVQAVNPARLLDTRAGETTADGLHRGTGRVAARGVYTLPVLGRGGVPTAADAVMLNVTAVTPSGPGYLTVFPCGTERPTTSNVNYLAGQTSPNAVLAKIGNGGAVCIFSLAEADLVVDVNGFVPTGGTPVALAPARLADTRPGEPTTDGQYTGDGQLGDDDIYEIQVAGRGGVPSGTPAVLLNVTATGSFDAGYLTLFPCDQDRPHASNVNYLGGQTSPNAVLAKLSNEGTVCVYAKAAAHVIVDVNGHVPIGGAPIGLLPSRLLDTRPGGPTDDDQHSGSDWLAAGATYVLPVLGRGGVPGNAAAVMLNVTAIAPHAAGYLTVFPCGAERPKASNVNYGPGDVAPNAVLAQIGAGGAVCIYTLANVQLAVDVNGYVKAPPPPLPPGATYSAVAAGDDHTCAVVAGYVQCWGSNVFGQLGTGSYGVDSASFDSPAPLRVEALADARSIDAGRWLSCASTGNGAVWCWGDNSERQLGGASRYRDEPAPIQVVGVTDATAVATGEEHACALRSTGAIACWGANFTGQRGNGTTSSSDAPTPVSGVSGATAMTAGRRHSCAVTGTGLRCWGSNGSGQLGDGSHDNRPTPITVTLGGTATAVAAGDSHTCALRGDATVWCWGDNTYGQLGRSGGSSTTPVQVTGLAGATALAAGGNHTCAVVGGGAVRCWGNNANGQLGRPIPTVSSDAPVVVTGLTGANSLAGGAAHTCAHRSNGTLTCWGSNAYSQLGSGEYPWRDSPGPVSGLTGVAEIEGRRDSMCARRTTGAVMCWGAYDNDTPDPRHWWTPQAIGNLINATALGGRCAVRTTGVVACWGTNYPAEDVSGVSGATDVFGTHPSGCAVLTSGSVRCWDDPGWFGTRVVTNVAGISNAVSVTGSGHDYCALRSNGSVACWNLEDMDSVSAQAVSGVSGATSVSPGLAKDDWGAATFCAAASGNLACWEPGAAAAVVAGVGSVTAVSGTSEPWTGHLCVLVGGGAVECWGEANEGRLGRPPAVSGESTDPSVGPTERGRPIQSGAVAVAVGERVSCALRANATVACWGDRRDGKLGDGTGAWSYAPVPVAGP
ncbi:MAG TPA: hypothetical protein VNQ73_09520 [Ilumatobacter sp.]|nr:hypothetical protein [Ilumatobacter sp.]